MIFENGLVDNILKWRVSIEFFVFAYNICRSENFSCFQMYQKLTFLMLFLGLRNSFDTITEVSYAKASLTPANILAAMFVPQMGTNVVDPY